MSVKVEAQDNRSNSKVLMLAIGCETFAVDAALVREIIDPIPTTRVTGARPHLPSVINVRGNIVPLADIRERFGMPPAAYTPDTRFVVIEIEIEGDTIVVSLVADKVLEVTQIDLDNKQPISTIGTHWRPEFIRSIVGFGGNFIIIPEFGALLN